MKEEIEKKIEAIEERIEFMTEVYNETMARLKIALINSKTKNY